MRIFKGKKGCGKTRFAVEMAIRTDSYLVVKNRVEAKRIFADYHESGLRFPVTYEDVLKSKSSFIRIFNRSIIVDDMDDFVAFALRNFNVLMTTIDDDFQSRVEIVQDLERKE